MKSILPLLAVLLSANAFAAVTKPVTKPTPKPVATPTPFTKTVIATVATPRHLAVDPEGNLYIAALGTESILKISGGVVSTVSKTFPFGFGFGLNGVAVLNGNCFASDQLLYLAVMPPTIVGGGAEGENILDGCGKNAEVNYPDGLASDNNSLIYFSDRGANLIRSFRPQDGLITTIAGSTILQGNVRVGLPGYQDGPAEQALFNQPKGIAYSNGTLYVADYKNGAIRTIRGGNVSTFISGLCGPSGVAVDPWGNVFVACLGDGRILKISPNKAITVLDTGSAYGVAVDKAGNLYYVKGSAVYKMTGY